MSEHTVLTPLPETPAPTTGGTTTISPEEVERRFRQAARILANGAIRAAQKKRAEQTPKDAPREPRTGIGGMSEIHTSSQILD